MERRIILTRLLDKYENSKHLLEPGVSKRRVMLRVDNKDLPEYDYENAETRDAYNKAGKECEQQGLISITWLPGRPVFSELILNLDHVYAAYSTIGKLHPKDAALSAAAEIEQSLCGVSTPWILSWQTETVQKIRSTYRIPSFFSDRAGNLGAFLTVLLQYDALRGAASTMRAFSIRCFQNSKRFEHDFRDEFLRIAQQHDLELKELCQHQEMGWRDKLAYLGIYARPESYEMSGMFSIFTSTGVVDCSALFPCGLAILSSSVDDIQRFDLSNIQKVVFIENKTNYDEYLNSEIQGSELVIYHGGFLSPQKRKLIQIIRDSLPPAIPVFFWADIDLGGFQMFSHLQQIIPELLPMRMSAEDVRKYSGFGLVRTAKYLRNLEEMLQNGEHRLFHKAIREILNCGKTIEQEVFLNDQ